jgi:hypothetical protein
LEVEREQKKEKESPPGIRVPMRITTPRTTMDAKWVA